MTENMNWFAFVVGLVVVVITLTITITKYHINTNERIVEMVKAGANPVSAACAVDPRVQICMAAGMIENRE